MEKLEKQKRIERQNSQIGAQIRSVFEPLCKSEKKLEKRRRERGNHCIVYTFFSGVKSEQEGKGV